MLTEEFLKTIVLQIPAVGILLVFVVTLYRDMRNDAVVAQKQREESTGILLSMKEEITKLNEYLRAAE